MSTASFIQFISFHCSSAFVRVVIVINATAPNSIIFAHQQNCIFFGFHWRERKQYPDRSSFFLDWNCMNLLCSYRRRIQRYTIWPSNVPNLLNNLDGVNNDMIKCMITMIGLTSNSKQWLHIDEWMALEENEIRKTPKSTKTFRTPCITKLSPLNQHH